MGALKLAHDPHSLIPDIVDAANDLDAARVILNAKALQISVKPGLRAVQRFQNCNGRQISTTLLSSATMEVQLHLASRKHSIPGPHHAKG
jgi:hypothetical protein